MHPTWFRCFNGSSTRPSVRNAHGRLEKKGGGNCVRSCLCAEVPHEGGIFVLCFWCLLLLMFLCARSASAALFENKNRPHRAHNAHLCAHQAQLPRANQLVRQASISAGQMLRLSQMWRWRLAKRKQTHPTIKAVAFISKCFTQAWKPDCALLACETKPTKQEMQATRRSSKQIPKACFCEAVIWVVFILKLQVPLNANSKKHTLPRTNMHMIKLLDTLLAP